MPHPDVDPSDPWMAVEQALDAADRGYADDKDLSPLLAEIANGLQAEGVPQEKIVAATVRAIRALLGPFYPQYPSSRS